MNGNANWALSETPAALAFPTAGALPVLPLKAYPFPTGMDHDDIKARTAKIYGTKDSLMTESVHYGTSSGTKCRCQLPQGAVGRHGVKGIGPGSATMETLTRG
jgi:hypothetical protein